MSARMDWALQPSPKSKDPPMKSSLEKLKKFFKLESERGYDNRAVVGGLARMVVHWEAEARAEAIPEQLVQEVSARLRQYDGMEPIQRAEILTVLWRLIQTETGETLPPLQPPPVKTIPAGMPERPKDIKSTPEQSEIYQNPRRKAKVRQFSSSPSRKSPTTLTLDTKSTALNASLTVLPGVGAKHAQTLEKLGLRTLGDLLYFFPRRYDDYSKLKTIHRLWYGEEATVIGVIDSINTRTIRSGRMQVVEAVIGDGSGSLRVTWFNQPWIARKFHTGLQVVLSGKVDQYLGRLVMNNPEIELLEQEHLHTNRIVPVYPLTANITQRWLRRMMHQVITYWAPRVREVLPQKILDAEKLLDLPTTLLQAHFPTSAEQLQAARLRLAFDEIFFLQLGVLRQKRAWQNRAARVFSVPDSWLQDQIRRLPYQLTNAQQRVLAEVRADLASGHPMNRLLQGDVGSGKTIIAALAIAMVTYQNAQAALIAPTSILAEQHYKTLYEILCEGKNTFSLTSGQNNELSNDSVLRPDQICLLQGSTPETEKQAIREGLANGSIRLAIGTHALLEEPVKFADLQLVIIDEQHRFGVEQRSTLRSKGTNPHLMVMTATPIPRSLALTIYGDLDLSVMDEMPPGRQPVETRIFFPRERERAYAIVRNQIEQNHQAFIIYPLIEESENSEVKAAVEEYHRLQEVFPQYRLGLLHGRLKADEKENVMTQFRDGRIQILVSTSVIEVGVDVPNATVMLIEGANRFGLAQLHQFRGRVGRSLHKAYCILIPDTADAAENERLSVMVETQNGFILAEKDLEQRGPGEFLGKRQSGFHSELRFASLTDVYLIEKARRQAQLVFNQDPYLEQPEHQSLKQAMTFFWGEIQGDMS